MSESDSSDSSIPKDLAGPARDFATFAERELERRRNSEADFDLDDYHAAVRLVLNKLDALD